MGMDSVVYFGLSGVRSRRGQVRLAFLPYDHQPRLPSLFDADLCIDFFFRLSCSVSFFSLLDIFWLFWNRISCRILIAFS